MRAIARSKDAGPRFRMQLFNVDIVFIVASANTILSALKIGVRLDIEKEKRKDARGARNSAARNKPVGFIHFICAPYAMFLRSFARDTLDACWFFFIFKKAEIQIRKDNIKSKNIKIETRNVLYIQTLNSFIFFRFLHFKRKETEV